MPLQFNTLPSTPPPPLSVPPAAVPAADSPGTSWLSNLPSKPPPPLAGGSTTAAAETKPADNHKTGVAGAIAGHAVRGVTGLLDVVPNLANAAGSLIGHNPELQPWSDKIGLNEGIRNYTPIDPNAQFENETAEKWAGPIIEGGVGMLTGSGLARGAAWGLGKMGAATIPGAKAVGSVPQALLGGSAALNEVKGAVPIAKAMGKMGLLGGIGAAGSTLGSTVAEGMGAEPGSAGYTAGSLLGGIAPFASRHVRGLDPAAATYRASKTGKDVTDILTGNMTPEEAAAYRQNIAKPGAVEQAADQIKAPIDTATALGSPSLGAVSQTAAGSSVPTTTTRVPGMEGSHPVLSSITNPAQRGAQQDAQRAALGVTAQGPGLGAVTEAVGEVRDAHANRVAELGQQADEAGHAIPGPGERPDAPLAVPAATVGEQARAALQRARGTLHDEATVVYGGAADHGDAAIPMAGLRTQLQGMLRNILPELLSPTETGTLARTLARDTIPLDSARALDTMLGKAAENELSSNGTGSAARNRLLAAQEALRDTVQQSAPEAAAQAIERGRRTWAEMKRTYDEAPLVGDVLSHQHGVPTMSAQDVPTRIAQATPEGVAALHAALPGEAGTLGMASIRQALAEAMSAKGGQWSQKDMRAFEAQHPGWFDPARGGIQDLRQRLQAAPGMPAAMAHEAAVQGPAGTAAVQRFRQAFAGHAEAPQALQDALAQRYAQVTSTATDPIKAHQTFMRNFGPAIEASGATGFSTPAQAYSTALEQASRARAAAETFTKSAASKVLGEDPAGAMKRLLGNDRPVAAIRDLMSHLPHGPAGSAARAGLQNALMDHITESLMTMAGGKLTAHKVNTAMKNFEDVAREVLTPKQQQALKMTQDFYKARMASEDFRIGGSDTNEKQIRALRGVAEPTLAERGLAVAKRGLAIHAMSMVSPGLGILGGFLFGHQGKLGEAVATHRSNMVRAALFDPKVARHFAKLADTSRLQTGLEAITHALIPAVQHASRGH